ncbi:MULTISPECIES: response regulator transcription factor [Streptomyces]|uniref:Response regulator transcription factor n=1 Tax=Streptomyces yunnanensis TaxID=156453 RepID=A0ABY8AIN3_9ACTN|nr:MULTISPECIES: response regulator transcription factor [Streptomyces]QRX90058.1 response regulator transcription factor [Streptomyces noursei]UJB39991.1 response regulator transcription factor [Streptomyces sp. A1-5]WEB44833.1 response regulator transcription factor [Streptomyces yunnanensis]
MSDRPIRVIVADDQAAVRDGLVTILDHEPDIDVVGSAADGATAVELARHLTPAVVLMDLRMPGVDGIAATRTLTALDPAPAVLVLTTYADDASIVGALQAGAAGYLTKSAGRAQIVSAITATADGHRTFAPEIASAMVRGLTHRTALERIAAAHALTVQETRVLQLLSERRTNRAIAESLYVSVATVKTHVNNLFGKLQVGSRAEAAALVERVRDHGL